MPHYTPSNIANERSHLVPDSTRTHACHSCGDTMNHLRTIPKLGVRPEKLIFICPSCEEVDTKELISARREIASYFPNHSTFQNS
jgi:hypothetical protein